MGLRRAAAACRPGLARAVVAGLACVLGSASAAGDGADPERQRQVAGAVDGLRYREVLFHLYQDKHFSALADLLVARRGRPMAHAGDQPELLLAGLALNYGLHSLAAKTLAPLTAADRPRETRDIAHYYQARLAWLQGDLAGAEAALTRIEDTLPREREGERLALLVEVRLAQNRLADAVAVLDRFPADSLWGRYARYNTGIALIRAGRLDEAAALLEAVAERRAGAPEEAKALADRARLALGYAFFSRGRNDEAVEHFSRIRLNGPFANQALLGLGWARAVEGDYQHALVPWLELRQRHAIDPSVQEGLVAIPHVLERMDRLPLAVQHYEQAIATLEKARADLLDVVRRTRSGEFLRVLRPAVVNEDADAPWRLEALPEVDAAPYLVQLLGSRAFQQAFADYRTLLFLDYVHRRWAERLPAFITAVDTRKKAYGNTRSAVEARDFDRRAAALERRYRALQARLAALEDAGVDEDLALATAGESALLARIEGLLARLDGLGHSGSDHQRLRRRLQAARGQIRWAVLRDFAPRLWTLKESFEALDTELARLQAARTDLARIRNEASGTFTGFEERFAGLQARLQALRPRLDRAISAQEQHIQNLVLAELARRRQVLERQLTRARFSLVRLLDTLSEPRPAAGAGPGKPGSGDGDAPGGTAPPAAAEGQSPS